MEKFGFMEFTSTDMENSNNVSLRVTSFLSSFCRSFFFHGGHLAMRSEGCTMAKLENHRNENVKSILQSYVQIY